MLFNPNNLFSHSEIIDSSGWHKDNHNTSDLGYYNYHNRILPHLHPNGTCTYNFVDSLIPIDSPVMNIWLVFIFVLFGSFFCVFLLQKLGGLKFKIKIVKRILIKKC